VRVLFFTQTLGCETCVHTRQILDELPALSDRVTIEEVNFVLDKDKSAKYGIDRVPGIAVVGVDESGGERDSRIRFLGAPEGWDFLSLVDAVLLVGGASTETLSEATIARVGQLTESLALQVFVTPT